MMQEGVYMLRVIPQLFPVLRVATLPPASRSLHTSPGVSQMDLRSIVSKLEQLAPPRLAAEWDNVGLLVEPSRVGEVERVFLTNDLTEAVMEEVENLPGKKVGLIVAYHPPIFRPLKRLTQRSVKERIIIRAIEQQTAIYSPHTACDSVEGGVNDWLVSGLGSGTVSGLRVTQLPAEPSKHVTVHNLTDTVQLKAIEDLRREIKGIADVTSTPVQSGDPSAVDVVVASTESTLPVLLPLLTKIVSPCCKITATSTPQMDVFLGAGRLLTLGAPISLTALVNRVKAHLDLQHVRLARPHGTSDPTVTTVAVCAGSGASVLRGIKADCYLAGEMAHHDVLEAVSAGTAVILTEHSNTERGYLHVFKQMLEGSLGPAMEVTVSQVDQDPLQVA